MTEKRLSVAVLWHMHQPDYVDGVSGRPAMPWVRLHAQFSYYDMVRLVLEEPRAKAVFNLVPSLLRQLDDAAAGRTEDDFLVLSRRSPETLEREEKIRLLRDFFSFNHARRFVELPRLRELWELRGGDGRVMDPEVVTRFEDQDILDLQVGFNLAWCGHTLREDPRIARLFVKGRDFSEEEKRELLQVQRDFLGEILPAYAEAAGLGQVELSCTPLTHPILPLLCDLAVAREAKPDLLLPATSFLHPGDAWFHVRTALDEMERYCGVRPRGMWPAEGSISERALRVFETEGLDWVATDQGVLANSWRKAGAAAPAAAHFQPYRWGGSGAPAVFFRDTGLSDNLGFRYQSWPAADAVADLLYHLDGIRHELPADGEYLVPLILDGENPWECYPDNGIDFLQRLYAGIADADHLAWTTFSEFLDRDGVDPAILPSVCAGSWIRGDFTTWIGHPEKNRGWEYLAGVRADFERKLAEAGALIDVKLADGTTVTAPDPARVGPGGRDALSRAMTALANAESSDWLWWYGDDNPTDFGREFDALFRRHLANVSTLLGDDPDPSLAVPVPGRGGQA
ncbi:glycoside hydrolase [bacterium]|nr:glycoside hydrolase [bacterium]MBU1072976.1 glycoside hydrolase [bacterium]MBU1674992.1 glycoside hydrolase [bacterium]